MLVGTRSSKLAVLQAEMFVERLGKRNSKIERVSSHGDETQEKSLKEIGGTGLFVRRLNEMVLEGRLDCAVHSAKDMPGESRKPEIRLIYGNAHETSYRENGVNFILNPMSVMLSKGNIVERGIPYPELKSPRRVLDMFSGIGYFSLPLGRKFTLETMTCVDINNDALGYLKKSYEASGFKFELILENRDCRDISTGEKFDTIIMGNFKSLNYLPHALSHADDQCSIILHHLEPSDSISRADYEIMRKCSHLGYSAGVIDSHMVKSYSPHMWHISTLINVRRKAFDKI